MVEFVSDIVVSGSGAKLLRELFLDEVAVNCGFWCRNGEFV